jgi:hypothetical protein
MWATEALMLLAFHRMHLPQPCQDLDSLFGAYRQSAQPRCFVEQSFILYYLPNKLLDWSCGGVVSGNIKMAPLMYQVVATLLRYSLLFFL